MRLAVGFFDGVHRGHQAILHGADAALTFSNHPLSVLAPERAPRLLMSVEERVEAIRACGIGEVSVLDFTPELARLTAEDFSKKLVDAGSGVVVRCGDNWRFGKGGVGDAAFLRARGIEVEVVSYVDYRGEPVSSSRIRRCLSEGTIEEANDMLGRPYSVRGEVVSGKGMGAGIGFPTLNIATARALPLRFGAYAVTVGGRKGVANFGLAPTMGEKAWREPVLEVHLLGDEPVASPGTAAVSFVRFLRAERKFGSLDDLKRQIAEDCEKVKGM